MIRSPLVQYQHDLQEREFAADATQAAAVMVLEQLYYRLVKQQQSLLRWLPNKTKIKGCYPKGNNPLFWFY